MASLLTRSFGTLLIAQACFGYAFASFFLLPKYLATEFHSGAGEIGRVMAAFGISAVVFIPVVGALVDRTGRRRFFVAGSFLMALSSFAFYWIDSVGPLLYALRVFQGLAFAMGFVAGATLAVDEAPPERLGQAIGLFGLMMLSMNAIGPAVVERVADRAGWVWAFTTPGIAALVATGLALLVSARSTHADGEADRLWDMARRPRSLRIGVVVGLAGAAFGAVVTFYQPFALDLGVRQVGGFFVAYTAAAMAARLGLGRVIDTGGRNRLSIYSLALYGVAVMAMMGLGPGRLVPLGALFGLAHGVFYPAFNALAMEGIQAQNRGKMTGLFFGAFNVGFSGGTFLLGILAEQTGYPAAFFVAGLGTFAALAILLASPEGRTHTETGVSATGATASERSSDRPTPAA
jgi:MFS family permease